MSVAWRVGHAALALALTLLPLRLLAAEPATHDIHYRVVTLRLDVPSSPDDEHASDERRHVEWSYPVFADTHDPATRALNGWLRLASIAQLLPPGALAREAPKLTDRQVVARAIRDPAFIASSVERVWVSVHMAAGRYRTFDVVATSPREDGSVYSDAQVDPVIYDMRTGKTPSPDELFVDGADTRLETLFQVALQQPGVECREERHFDWTKANLTASDTLVVTFPFERYEDPRCQEVQLDGEEVSRLLRAPGDLQPTYRLVDDSSLRSKTR